MMKRSLEVIILLHKLLMFIDSKEVNDFFTHK